MMKSSHLRHRYYKEEIEGMEAKRGEACPYPCSELGRRCAWLAGYRDSHNGE